MHVSKPLIGTLVALFLAVDVALGVAVWRHMGWSGGPGVATATQPPVTEPTATDGTATSTPGDGFQRLDPSSASMMGAASDGTVIVATAGACSGSKPSVLVSSDAGNTLAPTKPTVSRVLAVDVQSDGSIHLTGADAACKPVTLSSRDAGATWAKAPLTTGWYLDPESPTGVISPAAGSPGGTVDVGCTVVGVSAVDRTAADAKIANVLCDDGTVTRTEDAGKNWQPLSSVSGVRAVNFDSATSGVALAQTNDCAASTFVTADGGDTWDERGCIEGNNAQAVLDLGRRLLAVVDAKVATSTDGGLTWRVASAG